MIVIVLVALLNAISCDHDWCAAFDKRQSDDCRYISVAWWRYQKPETSSHIEVELRGCE